MIKTILFLLSCLIGTCNAPDNAGLTEQQIEGMTKAQRVYILNDGRVAFMQHNTLSGNYLAAQFAQNHHDWKNAVKFINRVIERSPENLPLINKAMVLAVGAGETDKAIEFAHTLQEHGDEEQSSISRLLLTLDAIKKNEYDTARSYITDMPGESSLSDFIAPVLASWIKAAEGELDTDELVTNTIHIYHAILIGNYLDKTEQFDVLLQRSLGADGLSVQDLERIGDVFTLVGKYDTAIKLYTQALHGWPENKALIKKIETLEAGEEAVFFKPVNTIQEGISAALYDMAQLLFHENSDDSARVFANMALYLTPDLEEANLLLGYITARNKQYDEAIAYYQSIKEEHDRYKEARRLSADLLEEMGRVEDAVDSLEKLAEKYDDIDATIQIGDIYRRNEDFSKAVKAYNDAEKQMEGKIPAEYWYLHYVRGMSYERLGKWKQAEEDLQSALDFKPNHALVLNYLGYAWADQGINLEKSLELIHKAASLDPEDGYITDSLGWVFYRMGRYEDAIPHLERAVELLPYDPVINDHLGDAYWQVGRKLEARFQWQRAFNHSEDEELSETISTKLVDGLKDSDHIKEALVTPKTDDTLTDENKTP